MDVHHGQHHRGNDPAQGIGQQQHQVVPVSGEHGKDVHQPHAADAQDGHNGRRQRIPVPPQGPGQDIQHPVQVQGGGNQMDPLHPQADDLRIGIEQADDLPPEQHNGRGNAQKKQSLHPEGRFGGAQAPVQFPGPVVLSHKGGGGLAEPVHKAVDVELDDHPGRSSSHHSGSQAVQGGLDHHVAHGEHHALDAGRKPDLDDVPELHPAEPHMVPLEPDGLGRAAQQHKQEQGVHRKAQHRGTDHPGQSQIQHRHRKQVQGDVQDIGRHQAVKRGFPVSTAAEDGRLEVVQGQEGHAQQEDPQVGGRQVVDLLRYIQDLQGRMGDQLAHDHQQHPQPDGHKDGGLHRLFHLVLLPGPQILGNHHIGPQGDPDQQRHQKADDGHVVAHRSHGVLPHKMAQDEHIHAVEQLFEQPHEPDGHGKKKQFVCNGAVEHVQAVPSALNFRHSSFPHSRIRFRTSSRFKTPRANPFLISCSGRYSSYLSNTGTSWGYTRSRGSMSFSISSFTTR